MTHLQLVPDPPLKPERRRAWKPSKRRRRIKPNRSYLMAYEESIIVRDLIAIGGSATARELRRQYPMRYHPTYLVVVLNRMAKGGRLKRSHGRSGARVYIAAIEGRKAA